VDFSAFTSFDVALTGALRSVTSPPLTRVMWIATLAGDTPVMVAWTALAVVLLWAWGRRRPAVVLAVLMLLDPWLSNALKAAIARPRPPVSGMLVALPSGLSFPSGHALATGLFFGLLALFALRGDGSTGRKVLTVIGALVAALLVGASRVYLSVHYPSDVVASWLFADALVGAGWGLLVLWDRLAGPEKARDASPVRDRRLRWLVAACAVAAVVALVVQAGADPLL
jgi:undecaprenyl-diphosphatase